MHIPSGTCPYQIPLPSVSSWVTVALASQGQSSKVIITSQPLIPLTLFFHVSPKLLAHKRQRNLPALLSKHGSHRKLAHHCGEKLAVDQVIIFHTNTPSIKSPTHFTCHLPKSVEDKLIPVCWWRQRKDVGTKDRRWEFKANPYLLELSSLDTGQPVRPDCLSTAAVSNLSVSCAHLVVWAALHLEIGRFLVTQRKRLTGLVGLTLAKSKKSKF